MGWLIPLLVLLPNALLVRFPPTGKPENASGANRWLEALERLGQAGVFAIPCLYRIRIQDATASVGLTVMVVALTGYYTCWLRYIQRGRRYALLYAPIWGIPLPMAVLPVVYFGAAAAMLCSWPLAVSTLVFAIGHLAMSAHERRKITSLASRESMDRSLPRH